MSEKNTSEVDKHNEVESQNESIKDTSATNTNNQGANASIPTTSKNAPKNITSGLTSSKIKSPTQISHTSKNTTPMNKSNLKSPGSTTKSALSNKSGFPGKKP